MRRLGSLPPTFSLFLFLWGLSHSGVNGQGAVRDLPIGLFPLSALGLPCLRSGGGGKGGSVLRAHPFFGTVAWCLFQTLLFPSSATRCCYDVPVCLPRAPALRPVLVAVLAEGALEALCLEETFEVPMRVGSSSSLNGSSSD